MQVSLHHKRASRRLVDQGVPKTEGVKPIFETEIGGRKAELSIHIRRLSVGVVRIKQGVRLIIRRTET